MIKAKTNYITYEFTYNSEEFQDVIIKAYIDKNERDKDGKYLLNVSLKTSDNMGLEHFVVGYYIDNADEFIIRKEIMSLADRNYFDTSIDLALEDEGYLEMKFEENFDK
jgi:hypothetical protein